MSKRISTAIGQLRMATWAHQLTGMGIRFALQEQLCDPTLQRIHFGVVRFNGLGRQRRQLGDIALDHLGKLDLDSGASCFSHGLANIDAELSQRLGTILGPTGCATAHPLGSKGLDLIVSLAIVKDRDLALHLAHLFFQVAQLLEELSGFRPGQERHRQPEYPCRPPDSGVFAISQAMCLLTS
jgi:hypothetical protein